ncbi:MAG TPA: tail fiber domain-containing protein [Candidatus Omnitrophota bacterium]|nr:tail fiber domain-containing protein [Candidatus Omnitrophota bacterium]
MRKLFIVAIVLTAFIPSLASAANIQLILDSIDGSSAMTVLNGNTQEVARIDSLGRIGIGKTPSWSLDINSTLTIGVNSSTNAIGGVGVYGTASSTGGSSNTGVFGSAASNMGGSAGVYGQATGSTAQVYGVYGYATGAQGRGVYGAQPNSGYGGYFMNSGSGYGGYFSNTSSGVGLYATSTSGYAAIFNNGNVGIGLANPAVTFEVGANHALSVNAGSGNIGVGTTAPEFKLSLASDGGILAKGIVGDIGNDTQGTSLSTSGSGVRMIWYPRKAAFRAGYVDGSQWDNANVGKYSVALGHNSQATLESGIALGVASRAGYCGVATGVLSVAGNMSTALGWQSTANGMASTATGILTAATGDYSAAFGWSTTASNQCSVTMGNNITNNYANALMIGDNTQDILLNPDGNSWLQCRLGYLGVGTTAPTDMLTVAGNVVPASDAINTCGKSGKRWYQIWASTGTIQTSDDRIKAGQKDLGKGLADIEKLKPKEYFLRNAEMTGKGISFKPGGKKDIGLIAQELYKVIPEAVYKPSDEAKELWGINYEKLIPVMIKAIQEEQKTVAGLQKKVDDLAADKQTLESRIKALEAGGRK